MTMPSGAEIASADAPVISGARQWPATTRQEEYAADRTGPVYFLLHIPKTAGQTIQVHLAEHCAPGAFWQSQRRLRLGRPAAAQDFPDFDRARVISGHHIGRSLERYFPGRAIRRIVLLRDPLQMQLSFYNWKMMDHLAKGWGTYSFSLHLRALPRNFMTHFLLSRWVELSQLKLMAMSDTRKYQILNRALASFWFVGAHSDCNRVIAAIGADLGVPPMAAPRNTSAEAQAHTGWRLVTAQSLSPSVRAALRAKNALDYALWESWGAAGFEAAKVRPAALSPERSRTALAHEAIRPWFRLHRFVRREWVGRRLPSTGPVDRANSARDAGDWELAARHYRDALRVIPNASAIWVQYGHALKESGHVAEAEQAYRRSLQLNPDNADTHLQLGHALKLQQRFGEAANAYLEAARLDPTFEHARNDLIGLGWPAERIAGAVRASERGAAFPSSESG